MKFKFNIAYFAAIIIVLIVLFPSCVAKKKFVEMEGYKTRAENRVVQLNADVAALKEEFTSYSNTFHYNNSKKDQMIDSLQKIVVNLNYDLSSSNESIDDQIFSFQVEKRRLNQLLAEKDREIRRAQRSSDVLKERADDLQREISDLTINLRNSESTSSLNERQLAQKDREIEKLTRLMEGQKTELALLKKRLDEKDEQVKALSNQVKLLKSQFGQQ